MRGRPFEVAWREADTPEALKAAYQKERDPEVRTRLHWQTWPEEPGGRRAPPWQKHCEV